MHAQCAAVYEHPMLAEDLVLVALHTVCAELDIDDSNGVHAH
jgi:hypothetical protein